MSSLQAIRDALEQSPDNLSLLLLYGRASLEMLQLEDARIAFERVLALDPDHTDAQLGIARVLFMEGDTSGAAVRAERVLLQEPDDASAHLLLSRVYLSENDRARAIEHFDLAAQIDGTMSDPALERELGRTARDARRTSPATPTQAEPSMPNDGLDEGEASQEFYDDALEEPPYDWRPETFFTPGDPNRFETTFADVGGMDELKEEIRLKIIYPLQYPDLYKAYGRRTGGGILIYGPPGCGKTLVLRAVAGEVPCNYLSVGLHEIFDPYFGSTERNLHQIFETARANAPCVLVFDDLDSLAQDRRNVRESQLRNLVNQFLHELDGLRENQRVLVIGATNQPWALDPAFRRPGRFDQAIFVQPPDALARTQIISLLAKDKPISNLDVPTLVDATGGFSGADLKWVFDRAAELALSAAIHTGQPVPITMELLLNVARSHAPTMNSWFEGVRDHAQQVAPDGIFNEVKKFLNAPSSRER
ncbi:Tetratricopeptide repeat-containing protein [Prosthecobacter debontii]|uniref:Tetratricopeptide repeat-containing protein n=1 Tax=Prosthecobacter debontii TaxID=48467 RepID=A0A1T4XI88_9BACT|nr:ATP-binding protein [Prosthecobacter debontii]SKA89244.1 Tetratricopeptide repeat-containing protein [Prosthecobacter debontii]